MRIANIPPLITQYLAWLIAAFPARISKVTIGRNVDVLAERHDLLGEATGSRR